MHNEPASKSSLPDPTADLHWSDFRGPIQDIFANNAVEHPDRLCVIETASNKTPQRNFTYRQIHEGSNTLAHHLIESGVQRGEVIMIYAYRSVELVISIMGRSVFAHSSKLSDKYRCAKGRSCFQRHRPSLSW